MPCCACRRSASRERRSRSRERDRRDHSPKHSRDASNRQSRRHRSRSLDHDRRDRHRPSRRSPDGSRDRSRDINGDRDRHRDRRKDRDRNGEVRKQAASEKVDFAELIPGYQEMGPAEQMRARTKLALDRGFAEVRLFITQLSMMYEYTVS